MQTLSNTVGQSYEIDFSNAIFFVNLRSSKTMDKIDEKNISLLRAALSEASRITIATHTHPDGDAVGSSVAFASFLRRSVGKEVRIVFPDPVRGNIKFLLSEETGGCVMTYSEETSQAGEWILSSDVIFCLDGNSFDRMSDAEESLRASKAVKILIDHHLDPERESFAVVFSDTEVSSTCELLFYILLQMPEIHGDTSLLPHECLVALMTGMTTDSNNFANSVFPSTLKMASMLLEAGVDREAILTRLYNEYDERRLRVMGYLLYENMKIFPGGTALMVLDSPAKLKFGVEEGDTEGFVNMPLSIGKVVMSIFLQEDGDHFRVSVRSKEGVSANDFARKYFNGGGHEKAAGGKLFFGKDIAERSEAVPYVEKAAEEFLK